MIPYGRQHIGQAEIDAVVETLKSDFITQGPKVPEFEGLIAQMCHAGHAVAANSATSCLHVACLALGLGPGKRLWTSPNSFVASSNVGLLCGAKVDFVDIDPSTFNMSVDTLAAKLAAAEARGELPDIVMPVHFGGEPCDMETIARLGQRYGFSIIEDASHAVGARYRDTMVGSCRYSDITVFSFHPVKIVTTAEGGCATTNDAGLARKMALLRSHGVTRDADLMAWESDGPWYYHQVELGLNYRMTELQAALGTVQLARLEHFLARRHEIAARYREAFRDLPVHVQAMGPDSYSALHLFIIRLGDAYGPDHRAKMFASMREKGVGVNVLYIPIHTQPYYKALGFSPGDFPESVAYYERSMALPMFPDLTDDQQGQVIGAVEACIAELGCV